MNLSLDLKEFDDFRCTRIYNEGHNTIPLCLESGAWTTLKNSITKFGAKHQVKA